MTFDYCNSQPVYTAMGRFHLVRCSNIISLAKTLDDFCRSLIMTYGQQHLSTLRVGEINVDDLYRSLAWLVRPVLSMLRCIILHYRPMKTKACLVCSLLDGEEQLFQGLATMFIVGMATSAPKFFICGITKGVHYSNQVHSFLR